jgi:hypothetical protein
MTWLSGSTFPEPEPELDHRVAFVCVEHLSPYDRMSPVVEEPHLDRRCEHCGEKACEAILVVSG